MGPKEIGSKNSHKPGLRLKIIFQCSHVNKTLSLTDKHQLPSQEEAQPHAAGRPVYG